MDADWMKFYQLLRLSFWAAKDPSTRKFECLTSPNTTENFRWIKHQCTDNESVSCAVKIQLNWVELNRVTCLFWWQFWECSFNFASQLCVCSLIKSKAICEQKWRKIRSTKKTSFLTSEYICFQMSIVRLNVGRHQQIKTKQMKDGSTWRNEAEEKLESASELRN